MSCHVTSSLPATPPLPATRTRTPHRTESNRNRSRFIILIDSIITDYLSKVKPWGGSKAFCSIKSDCCCATVLPPHSSRRVARRIPFVAVYSLPTSLCLYRFVLVQRSRPHRRIAFSLAGASTSPPLPLSNSPTPSSSNFHLSPPIPVLRAACCTTGPGVYRASALRSCGGRLCPLSHVPGWGSNYYFRFYVMANG